MQFQPLAKPSVGIVYDADLGNSIDDALALASLYGFQGKSESRVVGVCTSRPGLNSAIFADILVRFYTGEPGGFFIAPPIGLTLGRAPADTPMMAAVLGKPFPRNIKQMNDTADPLAVFRNSLSAQYDGNAIVYLSGPATNLAAALALPGVKELVAAKARYLVAALGNYGNGPADPQVKADVAAAHKLLSDWPTEIVFAGTELNQSVTFPGASIDKEFAWAPEHPLREAYRASGTMPYDAPAAALAAAVYAVRPKDSFFKLSDAGTVTVANDGITHLTPSPNGKHRNLIPDPEKRDALEKLFVETASTHPVPRAPRFRPPQQKKQ